MREAAAMILQIMHPPSADGQTLRPRPAGRVRRTPPSVRVRAAVFEVRLRVACDGTLLIGAIYAGGCAHENGMIGVLFITGSFLVVGRTLQDRCDHQSVLSPRLHGFQFGSK